MKLTSILEAADDTRPGDTYQNKRTGEIFLVLGSFKSDFGTKWDGVEFMLKGKHPPYISAGSSTTVAEPKAWDGYKKIKLASKDKKTIQKLLKVPENKAQLSRADTNIKDVERYIR